MQIGETGKGIGYAVAAYFAWGLVPAFWKQLTHIDATELIAHRIVWSLAFVLLILSWQKRLPELKALLRTPRTVAWMSLSTTLIAFNWGLYVWAVIEGRITEASLGYYINPLANILLARLFLGERLSRMQALSAGLAGIGVCILALAGGNPPWLSLALALSFSLYGVIRKKTPALPLPGLAVETLVAFPIALGLIAWKGAEGTWAFSVSNTFQSVLVLASGAVTALPLLWFAHASKRLRYSTVGIIQYISPTLQLSLAVLVYEEHFTGVHALTFAFIWAGVLLYGADALLAQRRAQRERALTPAT